MKKLFISLLLVFMVVSLAACDGNKIEKVEEQLQGKWVSYLKEGEEIGTAYEFVDGRMNAYIYLYGEYTLVNTGDYVIDEDGIKGSYDYTISIVNGQTVKKENPEGQVAIVFPYKYEKGTLKVYYDNAGINEEMVKK